MKEHEGWKTVKEIKDILNKYDDEAYVFIQPHKYMIDYPFYIFRSKNDNVYFRLYDDMLLKEPIKMKIDDIIWKYRIKWWNFKDGINKSTKNNS